MHVRTDDTVCVSINQLIEIINVLFLLVILLKAPFNMLVSEVIWTLVLGPFGVLCCLLATGAIIFPLHSLRANALSIWHLIINSERPKCWALFLYLVLQLFYLLATQLTVYPLSWLQ